MVAALLWRQRRGNVGGDTRTSGKRESNTERKEDEAHSGEREEGQRGGDTVVRDRGGAAEGPSGAMPVAGRESDCRSSLQR
ncbi:hypothetical protein BHE74_00019573 [Ensete ventricosum]|nr:hypothetical protein GW17_00010507 [Ensete ventricosum]RWW72608.1 hypothetical protein BHE74_00019573 [Ensete ventricosum]RZR82555.1 hypothetical protein BHM03_00009004 [Ensete ventricosum]